MKNPVTEKTVFPNLVSLKDNEIMVVAETRRRFIV